MAWMAVSPFCPLSPAFRWVERGGGGGGGGGGGQHFNECLSMAVIEREKNKTKRKKQPRKERKII